MMKSYHMMECHHLMNTHNIEHTCCIFSASPADIFTPSCLDPHWPAGHLRSKHISYSWYDGKSSYDGTPSYDDFPSYENFLFGIWWIAIILTIQCMMELHHIMMLIHHKLYDSCKLYYCQFLPLHYDNWPYQYQHNFSNLPLSEWAWHYKYLTVPIPA